MSFLFVDRILRMDEGRFIQGIKQVTLSDTYLSPSWIDLQQQQLMSSIIGETLGQLGAWCVMHAYQFMLRPVAGVVSAVHIYGEANVGDAILLETTIDALDEKAIEYHSVATVRGEPIFSIESALGPMLPMEDFIDPNEAKNQFARIYRPGEFEVEKDARSFVGANNYSPLLKDEKMLQERAKNFSPLQWDNISNPRNTWIDFDAILEYDPGERVVAQKSVSLSAPYLSDHFPRKPVLPLTLLLQAKLQLASLFLISSFEDGHEFKPVTIRKIKMSGFVQPGDSIITTLLLKEKTDKEIVISYRTEMQGKRVCTAEALFRKNLEQ